MGILDNKLAISLGSELFFSPSGSSHVRLSRKLFILIVVIAMVPCLVQHMIARGQSKKMMEGQYNDQLVWQMKHTRNTLDHFLEDRLLAGGLKTVADSLGWYHR